MLARYKLERRQGRSELNKNSPSKREIENLYELQTKNSKDDSTLILTSCYEDGIREENTFQRYNCQDDRTELEISKRKTTKAEALAKKRRSTETWLMCKTLPTSDTHFSTSESKNSCESMGSLKKEIEIGAEHNILEKNKRRKVSTLSDRPFRAAAATAQAISEAQQEILALEPPPLVKRNKQGQIEVLVEKPVRPRKYTRRVKTVADCRQEASPGPAHTETRLSGLLEGLRAQYLAMLATMQQPAFLHTLSLQLAVERSRHSQLQHRAEQLQAQVADLVQDNLGILGSGLRDLGIQADTPPQFIARAKDLVCEHGELERVRTGLASQVAQLEAEQARLVQKKEAELLDCLQRQSSLSSDQLRAAVEREIQACVAGDREVTLSKVEPHQSPAEPRESRLARIIEDAVRGGTSEELEVSNSSFSSVASMEGLAGVLESFRQHAGPSRSPLVDESRAWHTLRKQPDPHFKRKCTAAFQQAQNSCD